MAFKVSMLVSADAAQAKKELAATKKAMTDTGKAADKLGKRGKTAARGNKAIAASADQAAAELRALAASERAAAADALKLGKTNKLAAGQVGNLTAQFNDIGVMLAAGQNPLQLALQQGTQITQVIGPMGAAGAVKALSSAFFQMLNPISLITIGSIAAGAALFNWLRGGREAARTFEDAISDLDDAVESYRKNAREAGADTIDLVDRFGAGADNARRYLRVIAEVRRREALIAAAEVRKKLTGDYGSYHQAHQVRGIAEQFDLQVGGIGGNRRKMARQLTGAVILAYEELDQVAGKSVGEQIAAWERLFGATESASEAVGGVTVGESQRLKLIAEQILRLRELEAVDESSARADAKKLETATEMLAVLNGEVALNALILGHGRKSAEVFNFRLEAERKLYELKVKELPLAKTLMAAWDQANPRRDPQAERVQSAYRYLGITKQQAAQSQTAADQLLASIRDEGELRLANLIYGKDSAIVTDLRWQAELRVLETQLDVENITGSNRDNIIEAARAAFDAENATIAWASAMSGVGAELRGILSDIAGLGGGLISNAAKRVEIDALRAGKTVREAARAAKSFERDAKFDGRAAVASWFYRTFVIPAERGIAEYGDLLDEALFKEKEAARTRDRDTKGGGGGSRDQRDALTKLIFKEREELAILRTLDPIQKELLKNREALAGASEAELQVVESLIAARIREGLEMEILQESYDYFSASTNSFFDDLIVQGNSFNDVVGNLAKSLASAALQATILGTGPLASLLGTAGTSGLFGSVFGGLFGVPTLRRAGGGPVAGPGGPTDDRVLMWGSNGEFMVNAQATAKHRPLLEAINAGVVDAPPGFAAGGMVPAAMPILIPRAPMIAVAPSAPGQSASRPPAQIELHLSGDLDARIARQSESVAVSVFKGGIEVFSNEALPHRVQQIARDGKAIG